MQTSLPYRISRCLFVAINFTWMLVTSEFMVCGQDVAKNNGTKQIYDSQLVTTPLVDPITVASEAILPSGFKMQVVAREPDVQQPIAMAWDARGRLWIVENYTYAEAKVGFDLELSDRIIILEDTDANGSLDRRTVFWDQGKKLTSIEIDTHGVWAQTTPDLLFIPDSNQDDRPDGPPQVVLTGFAEGMHHNFANGLRFGPDGWLYGRHGITGVSNVGFPEGSELWNRAQEAASKLSTAAKSSTFGADEFRGSVEPQSLHCGIWRLNTKTYEFQLVTQGTTNPWGMDWDRYGNLFFINTVIGHLWHAIPNSHLQRMYGDDLDPYVYELLPHIADHVHWDEKGEDWTATRKGGLSSGTDAAGGGHAHSGMMIYQGNNWPTEYRDQLFTLNLHGQRVNQETLVRHGAGFVGKHKPDMVFWKDPWFRGIELSTGPDGSVYVIDWSDIGECHENDGVHRASGRIYRIEYSDSKSTRNITADLTKLPAKDLIEMLKHPNGWHARFAQRILCNGSTVVATSDIATIRKMLAGMDYKADGTDRSTIRLRAMWTLNSLGKLDVDMLGSLLSKDEPEEIQSAAIRMVADYGLRPKMEGASDLYRALLNLVGGDVSKTSGLIRLYLASLQPRLALDWQLAERLAQSSDLANDRDFPLVMWYGVKDRVASDPIGAAKFCVTCKIPKLTELVVRRLSSLQSSGNEGLGQIVEYAATQGTPDLIATMARGLWSGYEGRKKADAPSAWDSLFKRISGHPDQLTRERGVLLHSVFGDGIATDQLIRLATDGKASQSSRRSAIDSLASISGEQARKSLWGLVGDQNLGGAAATSIAKLATADEAVRLADSWIKAARSGKQGILTALMSKNELMSVLVDALEKKKIPLDAMDASSWRKFQMVADWNILERARKLNPKALELASDKEAAIQSLDVMLTSEALEKADASRGKVIWKNACANCHKLFGEGGQIGPELTGAQRTNKRYWLENILAPSAQVASNYRLVTFRMEDDTIISGVPVVETNETVTIQTDKEKITVETKDISERKHSSLSLMPDGILTPLSDQAKLDLFRYLMSPTQVP